MTAKEIITKSILMHPTLFAENLRALEITHRSYATLAEGLTKRGANASADACERVREWVGRTDLTEGERAACICAECGTMVTALNVAAKLQALPPHVRTAAAVDWEENHSA